MFAFAAEEVFWGGRNIAQSFRKRHNKYSENTYARLPAIVVLFLRASNILLVVGYSSRESYDTKIREFQWRKWIFQRFSISGFCKQNSGILHVWNSDFIQTTVETQMSHVQILILFTIEHNEFVVSIWGIKVCFISTSSIGKGSENHSSDDYGEDSVTDEVWILRICYGCYFINWNVIFYVGRWKWSCW